MPQLVLPFTQQNKADKHAEGFDQQCSVYRLLPPPLQEASKKSGHLLEYLHCLPFEKIGMPEYYPKLSRQLGDLKVRNLIYPVSDKIYIHVYSGSQEVRDLYIPIEPTMSQDLDEIMREVEARLIDFTDELEHVSNDEERKKILLSCVDKVCTTNGDKSKKKVKVTPAQLEGIKYLIARDKVGLGILEPLIHDSNIEDISCSGIGHIFLEHKIFKSLKCAININTFEELDEFILRLSERIGKPVTLRNPIVDAVLPDGSRINIIYGREVAKRGSNFTIRKFAETPLSVLELVEFKSLDYKMAAYLSMVMGEGMNVFVAGETASGKTTLLNAITTFIPPTAKIVSIEDTPELQVPHKNWIREVSRTAKTGDNMAGVSMFDLLKAALRQRPNMIIIGEIRGEEGNVAFQAMQTGHSVMATFHAASVERLIQRLTGNPINVPKTYIDNLNVVVIQSAVKLPNGKMGRRALSISEIVGYDPLSNSFSYVEVFRWNPEKDNFEFVGYKNSYLLEQKIAFKRGIPADKKWKIYDDLDRRAKILEKLHKEKGVKNFYELLDVLAKAQQQGLF
ncbi:MAG: type II/IV secretion system ATPase subunit [Chloroflexi bacterium]|nr:type II/IV secretion system ATPase subunit [Chloroflexota bacterium]